VADSARVRGGPRASLSLTVLAIGGAALLVAALVLLGAVGGPEATGALVVGPILFVASLPVFFRQARQEGDRWILRILVLALLAKFIGSVVRYYVAFDVYGGIADAAAYHENGVRIAENFQMGIFSTGLDSLSDTDFIRFLIGVVYTFIGPTGLGGFVVFSWLGFWGLFFFYRAFRVAVPEGRHRTYAKLLFFLPTLVFWPSSVGKEGWMMFSLGIAALGAARILSGRTWRGLAVASLGLWLATIVRPHVAGILALSLAAGYLFRRSRPELGGFATLGKVIGLMAVTTLAVVLVIRTDRFLEESAVRTEGGVASVLRQTSERTGTGGSEFVPSALESPARAPIAVVTVLFRPFLFEVTNAQGLAASLETTFLLGLCLARWRWIAAAVRSIRRQPYVAMAIAYTGLFILAFSAFANFGLLARERAQLFPMFLVLLCVPVVTGGRPNGSSSAATPADRGIEPVAR
jgi:hypothetical protein